MLNQKIHVVPTLTVSPAPSAPFIRTFCLKCENSWAFRVKGEKTRRAQGLALVQGLTLKAKRRGGHMAWSWHGVWG